MSSGADKCLHRMSQRTILVTSVSCSLLQRVACSGVFFFVNFRGDAGIVS